MKQVLFVVATAWELKVIKQEIKKHSFHNMKVYFLLSWIWDYSTILELYKDINNKNYDFIVNIWVCGYSGQAQGIAPTENNVGANLCVHPVIQISRIKNIANNKELIVPVFFKFEKLESIACSEKVIYSSEEIGNEKFVDMESYGVEFVCEKMDIPRIILKVPVDKIWEETKNFDFEKAKRLLAENIDYKKLWENIWEYLEKNDKKRNEYLKSSSYGANIHSLQALEKYNNYYKMTFAEKLIFEKLYNKYSVLIEDEWGEKFDIFFEKNKKLNKKDFFEVLER